MQIIKHIPNTITSMNALSGSIGVILCLGGNVRAAFILMLAAAVFDFFDGFAARALGAYSDIGKELDSLSDMISFGLLPSIMLHETMVERCIDNWISFIPLVLAIFSGLRLAKFNIDERQHDSFIGVATPVAAMISGSLSYYVATFMSGWLSGLCSKVWFIPALAIVLALLLVSEIPMFAMKFGKGKHADRATIIIRYAFLAIVAVTAVVVALARQNWSLIVLISFVCYILLNVAFAIMKSDKGSHSANEA